MRYLLPTILLMMSLVGQVAPTWAKDKPTITIEVVDSRAWTRDLATHHAASSSSDTNCNTSASTDGTVNGTIYDSSVYATANSTTNATTNCTTTTTTTPAYTSHVYINQESIRAIFPGGQHVALWCQNGFRKCFDLAAGTYTAEADGNKALRVYVYSLTTHKLMGKVKYRIAGSW